MLGKPVPDFSLASTDRSSSPATVRLSARRGQKSVLYIHPKFPFELLSDPDEAVCKQFALMKLKSSYPGHAQEVSNFVKAL
jgi:peroxiredoxin